MATQSKEHLELTKNEVRASHRCIKVIIVYKSTKIDIRTFLQKVLITSMYKFNILNQALAHTCKHSKEKHAKTEYHASKRTTLRLQTVI